jgi:hypothetical protein
VSGTRQGARHGSQSCGARHLHLYHDVPRGRQPGASERAGNCNVPLICLVPCDLVGVGCEKFALFETAWLAFLCRLPTGQEACEFAKCRGSRLHLPQSPFYAHLVEDIGRPRVGGPDPLQKRNMRSCASEGCDSHHLSTLARVR